MLEDSDRLLHTIEQVLRAGSARSRFRRESRSRVNLDDVARECVDLARTRFHLDERSLAFENHTAGPADDSPVAPVATPGQTGPVRPDRRPPHEAVRSGVCRSPENRRAGIDSWTSAREIELAMAATPAVMIERSTAP